MKHLRLPDTGGNHISQMTYHFSVYEHTLVIKDSDLIKRKFIVLKDASGDICAFTDFHRYIRSAKRQYARRVTDDGNSRHYYVVKLLNYAFFDKYHIRKLNDMTIEMVSAFLNDYGKSLLPDDSNERTKSTVIACIRTIIDFLDNFIEKNKGNCKIKQSELYKTVTTRNKRGNIVKKKIPAFDVTYTGKVKSIFRDMPNTVFNQLMNLVIEKHTDILMLVALSAFAGLRPAEACNIRRTDSALGPGIRFVIQNGEITDIILDLKKELNLRSDLKSVGSIKKERIQRVYPAFLEAFVECYRIYMDYMKGRKYEVAYGALTVNLQGKAITYDNYYQKFRKIISELIPILLSAEDAEVVSYGHLLLENNISPHILRHWFSVKLTLYGEDVSGLMYWRGDSSPESALTYLQNKGDLEKQFRHVNTELFDFISWQAATEYGDLND